MYETLEVPIYMAIPKGYVPKNEVEKELIQQGNVRCVFVEEVLVRFEAVRARMEQDFCSVSNSNGFCPNKLNGTSKIRRNLSMFKVNDPSLQ